MQIFPALGDLFLRTPGNVTIFGYLPVMFMCLGSAFWMWLVSLLTPPPIASTTSRSTSRHEPACRVRTCSLRVLAYVL